MWNLTFIFAGSHKKFSLVLLQMTNYIFSPWKMQKKDATLFKLFWPGKVFVHWKLKLLNFVVDFVLSSFIMVVIWNKWPPSNSLWQCYKTEEVCVGRRRWFCRSYQWPYECLNGHGVSQRSFRYKIVSRSIQVVSVEV